MLLAVLSVCSEEELDESSSDEDDAPGTGIGTDLALSPNDLAARRQQIKNKILAVGRMQRVFQLLRCVLLFSSMLNTCADLEIGIVRKQRMPRNCSQLWTLIRWPPTASEAWRSGPMLLVYRVTRLGGAFATSMTREFHFQREILLFYVDWCDAVAAWISSTRGCLKSTPPSPTFRWSQHRLCGAKAQGWRPSYGGHWRRRRETAAS